MVNWLSKGLDLSVSFQLPAWYPKFNFFASYVAYANSAFNPIIYTGFNENFKRGALTEGQRLRVGVGSGDWVTGWDSEVETGHQIRGWGSRADG